MAKLIYLYKYAADLYSQLVSVEEGLEDEYHNNDRFVSLDDAAEGDDSAEEDGREVLREYHRKLAQHNELWSREWSRLVPRRAYCLLSTLAKRMYGCERPLSRSLNLNMDASMQQHITESQALLNNLQARLDVIKSSDLRTYFSVQAELDRCLDKISDDIHSVGSNVLSHHELTTIADRIDCDVLCDMRHM